MRRLFAITSLAVVLACGLTVAPTARAQDRKADQILKDLENVKMPQFDRAKVQDRAAITEFLQKRQEAMSKRAALIGELYKIDPENAKLAALLPERWQALLSGNPADAAPLAKELKDVLAKAKDGKLKADAAFFRAVIEFRAAQQTPEALLKATDDFIKVAPKDERGAMLLNASADMATSPEQQAKLLKRVIKEYPTSSVAKSAEGTLHKLDAIGKPFDLEFTEAIKGTTVSMKNLKGKVVVIDFWATWCGPCVGEMPNMKKLYAEYKDKGVEFIGVSLDQPKEQGGLAKLKEFVAKNEIGWPQYYQGNGWESDFSRGWGVNAIPAVFVVDPQGKLHSINARGKLDEIIPELLKKAKSGAAAGAGAGAGGY